MGIGSLSTIGLSEARERARALRVKRLDDIDPIEERRAARTMPVIRLMTFDEAAQAYLAERENTWKSPVHRQQWRTSLRDYVSPVIGKSPVNEIETKHVTAVLDRIWSTMPVVAGRVRGRIEAILDWARVRGQRDGENPAKWKGHLDHVYPAPGTARQAIRNQTGQLAHHAALPYVEVPAFIATLKQRTDSSAKALEFAILTAARTAEVLGARWEEFDLGAKVWIVPGVRMKNNKEHRVPLSPQAVEIIESMAQIQQGAYVFPGDRPEAPLSQDALHRTLRKLKQGFTVHGFRSTFRDWVGETTPFPSDVAEAALAHVVKSRVQAAYQRGDLLDKRRQLMEAWGDYCTRPRMNAKVVPLTNQKSSPLPR
jgi:integrase